MAGHVIVLSRVIDAEREEVWRVLTDVAGQELALRHVQEVELLGDGPYAVGMRWREYRSLLGHRGFETLEVVECDPPRHTTVRVTSGRDDISFAYAVTAHGNRCRLSVTMVANTSGRSALGKVRWGTLGAVDLEATRRMLHEDLADIAATAEARATSWEPDPIR